jgi:hypothetical protein
MLEVKKVTYKDEEIEEKVKEAIDDPSKGESIEMSCRPITTCCPDTGWR